MLNTCISCSRQEIRLWAQLDDFINQIWLWQFHFKTKNLLGFQLCMLTFLYAYQNELCLEMPERGWNWS